MSGDEKQEMAFCAIRLMQEHGYATIRLSDVSAGNNKADHYFKTKDELTETALQTYRNVQLGKMADIDKLPSLTERMHRYIDLFGNMVKESGHLCLGMILTMEKKHVDTRVRDQIDGFYKQNIEWLEKSWSEGIQSGEIISSLNSQQAASIIFSALEGMMLFALNNRHQSGDFTVDAQKLVYQLGLQQNKNSAQEMPIDKISMGVLS